MNFEAFSNALVDSGVDLSNEEGGLVLSEDLGGLGILGSEGLAVTAIQVGD